MGTGCMKTKRYLAMVAILWLTAVGNCQTAVPAGYLNLDTSEILPKGMTDGKHDLRMFGGHENLTYATLSHRYGMGGGLEGIWRGVIASEKSIPAGNGGTIFFGGVDFEAALRCQLGGMVGLIGVSTPFTPAQKGPVVSLGLSSTRNMGEKLSVTLNPRAILVRDNTIVGLGFGANLGLQDRMSLSAEYTPILSGQNTRDVFDGQMMKRDLYGVALHYRLMGDNVSVGFGYTNATGGTTGFGLTPGLGGSGAFSLSIRGRY